MAIPSILLRGIIPATTGMVMAVNHLKAKKMVYAVTRLETRYQSVYDYVPGQDAQF